MTVNEHMISVTCKGIIDLLKGPHDFTEEEAEEYRLCYGVDLGKPVVNRYTEEEISEYMNTYVSDLKKYDADVAYIIENAYEQRDIDTIIDTCTRKRCLHL